MGEKVTVSVIIPVYNRKTAVQEAIESVLNQSYSDWELILADDGSTDGTLESLTKYGENRKVKVISLSHNGNPGYVRNRAVEQASGTWLAFLDSDDIWDSEKLSKQIDYLNREKHCRVIHSREHWVRNGKTVSQNHRKHRKSGDLFTVSLGKCEIGPSTVLMDRELFISLGGFREDLEICEDYEFWLRVTSLHPVGYIDEELVIKRAGAGDQLSEKYGFIEIFKIAALKKLVDKDWFSGPHKEKARMELAEKCRIYGKGCRKRGRVEEAEKYESLHFYYGSDDGLKEA